MAQSTDNEQAQRIREGYAAFGRGDLEALRHQFSPDIIWHVAGSNPMAGDYKGIDAVLEFFGRITTETAGTLQNHVHDVLTDGVHGVVLLNQTAERNGKKLSVNAFQVIHRDADWRVSESWFFPADARVFDEFWS
jgi:uncharacterized protein